MSNNSRNRQGARPRPGGNPGSESEGPSWWSIGLGVAAGIAAAAGSVYLVNQLQGPQEDAEEEPEREDLGNQSHCFESIKLEDNTDAISLLAVPNKPSVNNLNSLLNDIYVRYIAIKKEEFTRRYNVFTKVFNKLHGSMKAVDSYYERYSSQLVFRAEEFKMYIVIRVPVNMHKHYLNDEESDIVIEPKHSSFVQLRAGVQYQNILLRDGVDCLINRTAYLWLDDRSYILRSKFYSWFQSVVDRALNKLQRSVEINGDVYKLSASVNNGSYTLWITSASGFRFDVDLVPVLRFPEERWLGSCKAYREIPSGCNVDYWIVVPKPDKFGANRLDEDRSWHVAMREQEKKFIHNMFHLRQGMRLLKKLRDAQKMIQIENYHIETLFLWSCESFDKSFWNRDVATIFMVMLREFYKALQEKKISFFWKKSHNLLENVSANVLEGYARRLGTLVTELERDNYMMAAEYLLTASEYTEYKGLLNRYHC